MPATASRPPAISRPAVSPDVVGDVEWARNPYVLLITIYLFSPYFANEVVGDGVRGQAVAGAIQAYSGIVIAILAPFLGAIADCGGRRKPWIALYTLILAGAMFPMWFAMPHSTGWALFAVGAMMAVANVAYEFSAVFHNSLLPAIASPRRVAGLSGLGLALGNAAGVLLLLFMLIGFALPGHVSWPFVPAHPLFGIGQAAFEPDRLSGPVGAVWLLVFSLPLFFFTPDRPASDLPLLAAMREGVRSVIRTVKSLKHYRNVGAYLLARLFFNDGMTALLTFGGHLCGGHLPLARAAAHRLRHRAVDLRGAGAASSAAGSTTGWAPSARSSSPSAAPRCSACCRSPWGRTASCGSSPSIRTRPSSGPCRSSTPGRRSPI